MKEVGSGTKIFSYQVYQNLSLGCVNAMNEEIKLLANHDR